MGKVTFYIVRHGQTLLNMLNKAQGWCDSPLTEKGMEDAMRLGKSFRTVSFDAALSSDTLRARETARLILSSAGQEELLITEDRRLREWCLGKWEGADNKIFLESVMTALDKGNTLNDIDMYLPDVLNFIHSEDTTGMTQPFDVVMHRLYDCLSEIACQYEVHDQNTRILIVTHALAIKTILYSISKDVLKDMGKISNTRCIPIVWKDGGFMFADK